MIASAALGEFRGFDVRTVSRGAWLALAYLIVAGSIIAYTAYVWLLHHESPTKVGTYAYVNPVVAVAIGYFLGRVCRPANFAGNAACAGERGGDHDHAREKAGAGPFGRGATGGRVGTHHLLQP